MTQKSDFLISAPPPAALRRQFSSVPAIVWILALAFVLRLAVALAFPNIIAPDEVFQALEQAHRLVFGQGIVPWEFRVGLRSWLIPLVLAAPMALADFCSPNPLVGLALIRLLLVLAALPIVWTGAKWGEKFYGRQGLWIAGVFTALWPDLWVMAPHPLEEVLAADLLVPAVYLLGQAQQRGRLRGLVLASFLLGAAFAIRIQLAPAIAIAGIALCGRDLRRWRIGVCVGALPLLLVGLLDWFTWGQPFRSVWLNIYLNMILGVAKNTFGAEPAAYFIHMMFLDWLWTFAPLLFLCWRGAKVLPVAGWCIVAILLTHNLISHKEYRFIFPAIALAVPLAGVSLAEVWRYMQQKKLLSAPWIALGVALLAGPLISPFPYFMLEFQTNSARIFEDVARQHVALVSVADLERGFSAGDVNVLPFDIFFGASTRLTRATIVQTVAGPRAADAIVAIATSTSIPSDFVVQKCFSGGWIPFQRQQRPRVCVWLKTDNAIPEQTSPSPFEFPFPKQALPFMIKDRLAK